MPSGPTYLTSDDTIAISPRSVPLQFSDRQGWPVYCIIGFHDMLRRKPHPDSLVLALNRCGEMAAGSFHVGDRAQDT